MTKGRNLFLIIVCGLLHVHAEPRERISLNDDWRFTKGDPTNSTTTLLHDVRREQTVRRMADAEIDGISSTDRAAITNETTARSEVIKPWILPTGNAFIKDPALKFVRPAGNPGSDVPYVQPGFDDSSWERVTLPHDWAIEGPFTRSGGGGMGRLPSAGVGWYRRKLAIPAADAGKSIFLEVDVAMSYAAVWLNGQLVGGWPFGYASWELDLTPYIIAGGENVLAIHLDNPPNSSRWYPGAGIYRNVWLVKTAPVHVSHWGNYLTTSDVSPETATVNLEVRVQNDSRQYAQVRVATDVFVLDEDGHRKGAAASSISPATLDIQPFTNVVVKGQCTIIQPKLWGPPPQQHPNRYLTVTTVSQDGRVVDRYETPFGIRTCRWDPSAGVLINGRRIELKGVCDHHDLGALGAAFNYRAAQRQLELLQEMGYNATRTSHNPPAPELLELTDRNGVPRYG